MLQDNSDFDASPEVGTCLHGFSEVFRSKGCNKGCLAVRTKVLCLPSGMGFLAFSANRCGCKCHAGHACCVSRGRDSEGLPAVAGSARPTQVLV